MLSGHLGTINAACGQLCPQQLCLIDKHWEFVKIAQTWEVEGKGDARVEWQGAALWG